MQYEQVDSDQDRVAAFHGYETFETLPEREFDDLARLAA